MKPNTHGMPNARHIRRKTAREKLMATGWFTTTSGKSWKHPNSFACTYTLADAVKEQAAWDAKREAEVA